MLAVTAQTRRKRFAQRIFAGPTYNLLWHNPKTIVTSFNRPIASQATLDNLAGRVRNNCYWPAPIMSNPTEIDGLKLGIALAKINISEDA